ncbi:hypothetical protein ACQCX5_11285 [Propionibacteriaceae bacterium G57]|uniref:hypothetical protein n=1 Tax=Aestuariimicrobium sp. G57 TaxID=3418485 RepID=UPI003DA7988E
MTSPGCSRRTVLVVSAAGVVIGLAGCGAQRTPRPVPIESIAAVPGQTLRYVLTYRSVLESADLADVTVDETPQWVRILVRERQPQRMGQPRTHTTEITLKWPLDNRTVTDQSTGTPIPAR